MGDLFKKSQVPPVGYYFVANFFSPKRHARSLQEEAEAKFDTQNKSIDIRFQKISGFRVSMSPHVLEEGGQNLFSHRLPQRYNYENLVLERGLVLGSDISQTFQDAMTTFRFAPVTVLVSLLDEQDDPVMSWAFFDAYPVSWQSSDLDANANSLVIETLELAYTRFQRMKL